jgi:hypothetical protein
MDKKIRSLLSGLLLVMGMPFAYAQDTTFEKNDAFTIQRAGPDLAALWKTGDVYHTNYLRKGRPLGEVIVRYKLPDGTQDSASMTTSKPLRVEGSFRLEKNALLWTITLTNTLNTPLIIEDLALPIAYNSGGGEDPHEIFEQHVVKHHFIAGNNSFLFWERPTGVGPYLVMVPQPGTSLEYFSTSAPGGQRGVFQVFIHSALQQPAPSTSWRQPHTSLTLAPGSRKTYGFIFRWAAGYQNIRDIITEEGGIDVRVMPGMTLPDDIDTRMALRTRQKIASITPEFPKATTLQYLGEKNGSHLYKLHFTRLGENKLTIRYGPGYTTLLEFFVTQPLETLYKKRASFIVHRQQHKDPTKWYDGLFSIYDMKNHVLRGPDNPDYFDSSRLSYVLTCDDPGLCKAPFVAAKNCYYPDQQEIDALEYYIQHFVWGRLQRTDKETPYPYGVYGTPSWIVNRDTARRKANTKDTNRYKMHVWRSYDYPHIMMLYYHLYQIASRYPGMTHYLDRKGYLIRAKETARAFFEYPYEILPWYETYKWGCYNELLLVDLIADLEKEGYTEDARFLRNEWEKKVKYFLYDDPYPFRSEYAIDATAFESSHALARYALLNTLQPDSNCWYDKNLHRWYSHPRIRKEDAIDFMHRQIAANIALRGSIEPAYYYLGSDFRGRSDSYTLSYMSQMGGWSILDYGLHFAEQPADYIRLGYASYLSSFALINAGTPATNYGYWYPGQDNDGASGWAFEPQQYPTNWIYKAQGRGPWYYDGEIDLGFGGATRTAATVLTNDPVFGWVAYGGSLAMSGATCSVIPGDGLRRRFYYRNKGRQLDIELDRDGFLKGQPIVLDTACNYIRFRLEPRTPEEHSVSIHIKKGTDSTTLHFPLDASRLYYISLKNIQSHEDDN